MAHLIPRNAVFEKRAAFINADSMGREMAHDRVINALAVDAAAILKEAGIFSRLGGVVKKTVTKLVKPKVRISGRSGVTAKRSVLAKTPKAKAKAKQEYVQKNVAQQQAAKGPGQITPAPQVQAPPVKAPPGKVRQQSRAERVVGAPPATDQQRTIAQAMRQKGRAAAGKVTPAAGVEPQVGKVTPRSETVPTRRAKGEAPAGDWQRQRAAKGGWSAPGQVQPVGGPTPGKATGKLKKAPNKTESRAAQKARADAEAKAAKDKKWGVGKWLGAGALGVAGLGAYGVAKAVPHAARAMEQASTTPMAQSGGWSPTQYGYGRNPYGSVNPNMGYGG